MLKGFREFIMRGNVIDLAVAVVMGSAFSTVVNSLVKDLLTPLIAAIGGKPNFSQLKFEVHNSTFFYGDFVNAVVSFLLIAAAIYFVVVMPLNRLAELRRRRLHIPEQVVAPTEVEVLAEIRDLLRAGMADGPSAQQ